jgi:hypothetical protein
MEPPFGEEYDDLDEMDDELDIEAAANRRQFMLLVLGLGGVLVVAVVAFIIVMISQGGQKSDIELTNEAVLATNEAIAQAIVATETADVVQRTTEAEVMAATQEAQQQATADAALFATRTAEAQPTPTATFTATPVVSSPTPSPTPMGEGTVEPGEGTPDAVAQVTATFFPTRATGTTPDTGIGGLGAVLIASVLVVVMFAARRLRMAA